MRRRIPAFDVIRILAMFLIICYHWNTYCYIYLIRTPELLPLHLPNGNIATIGVSLFFILSGASLTYVSGERLDAKEHFKRRFLAIYPAYWISWTVMYVYVYILRSQPMTGEYRYLWLSFLGMDGLLNAFFPTIYLVGEWFTGCIICLYLLFPLLYEAMRRAPKVTAACGILLALIMIRLEGVLPLGDHFPIARVPEMLFGMYYARYLLRKEPSSQDGTGVSYAAGCGWIAAACLGAAAFCAMCLFPGELPVLLTDYVLGISSFSVLAGVLQLIMPEGGWAGRIAAAAAGYTYEIFLLHHVPIGDFLKDRWGRELRFSGELARFTAYFLIILTVSVIVDHFIKQIRRLLAKQEYHSHVRPQDRP